MNRSFIFSLLLIPGAFLAGDLSYNYQPVESVKQINYHNRPLIKINSKTISLVDVLKRMDYQILRQAPNILEDAEARYHYYSQNWRAAFNDLIEQELILIDSEPLKIAISESDIRSELENSFGINLILKLDKIGITLEEAKKMAEKDIIVRQMLWFKAYSKAFQVITPELIKTAYADNLKKELLNQKEEWCYQILTVKSKDLEKGEKIAEQAYSLLRRPDSILANIPEILKSTLSNISTDIDIAVSKEMVVDSQSISATHHEVLSQLTENQYSRPICQQLRNSKESVHRIFYLKKHSKQQPQTFDQLAPVIKEKLLQFAADKEKKQYVDSLKLKFSISEHEISEVIPKDYEPFALI